MSSEVAPSIGSSRTTPRAPFSSQFLDKDASATLRRTIYLKVFVGGMVMTTLAMYAIFSIYWGALYKAPVRNLDGWLVDFDGDQVGQSVVQGLTGVAGTLGKVTWTVHSASEFPGGPSDLEQHVVDEKTWVAIAINSGATSKLRAATSAADGSYDGSLAITVYGVEARSENAYRSIIRPSSEAGLQMISKQFAAQYIRSIASASNLQAIAQSAPTILSSPIAYTIHNVRPFDVPVASAVTFVGLIYLVILSFFIVMMGSGARDASGVERELSLASLLRLRLTSIFVGYFFISLLYSALSPAFGLPLDRTFGKAGFLVFWMLNFVGMLSLGLALEAMLTLVTIRGVPFFLLTWIITNVSVCFLPIEVLPRIFKYGYGFPFYNVSKAVRTIVFDTKNELGMNFGILLGWTALSLITLPIATWIARRRLIKESQAVSSSDEKD